MKARTRDQAMRLILSSLLRADLTTLQMREISSALVSDRGFSADLGLLVAQVVDSLEKRPKRIETEFSEEIGPARQHYWRAALAIVRRKRLPKRDVVRAIETLLPGQREDLADPKLTVRRILAAFIQTETETNVRGLLRYLEQGQFEGGDEYLKGIMRDT